jgi:hypothetical protein
MNLIALAKYLTEWVEARSKLNCFDWECYDPHCCSLAGWSLTQGGLFLEAKLPPLDYFPMVDLHSDGNRFFPPDFLGGLTNSGNYQSHREHHAGRHDLRYR